MSLNQRASIVQRSMFSLGAVLMAVYLVLTAHGAVSARLALREFDHARAPVPATAATEAGVGFDLWDARRIEAYRQSLLGRTEPPLGVISIARVRLRAPIFEGTDDAVLNRGAGWVAGTARLGDSGNAGVAAHRDGFFRVLKDVVNGDRIEIALADRTLAYRVDNISIVTPEDVSVLAPRERTSVTLITCYPFYFVGNAPKRYVVHASLVTNVNPEDR